jgi:hypothetical protein
MRSYRGQAAQRSINGLLFGGPTILGKEKFPWPKRYYGNKTLSLGLANLGLQSQPLGCTCWLLEFGQRAPESRFSESYDIHKLLLPI